MAEDQQVDWRTVRPRLGDWTCTWHGIITPAQGLVPYCDRLVGGRICQRIAWRTADVGGLLVSVEPRPDRCLAGHLLRPGAVLVGWRPCPCTPVGGHRTWRCRCDAESMWPPHDPAVTWPR